MGNLNNFNAANVDPQTSFDPIPAGWYQAMAVDSEMKPTRAGDGQYLQFRIDVIDGEYENRVLFERLNLDNPNQTAVEIAQRTLSSMCHAMGVLQPGDSSDLHNIPFMVKVGIQPAGNGYEASNTIKGYAAIEGQQQQAAATQAAAQQQQPPARQQQTAPQAQQQAPAAANKPAKKPWE